MDDDDELITVTKGQLRGVFDLAVGSMDFASGFFCEEDVIVTRAVAVALGLDPLESATPREYRSKFAHAFDPRTVPGCALCGERTEHEAHRGVGL